MKYVAAALGAACLLCGAPAALAKPSDIVVQPTSSITESKRENIKLRLPASLERSDPADVIALRNRAMREIERACNPGGRLNADMSPDWQCRREMAANLELALRQRAYGG